MPQQTWTSKVKPKNPGKTWKKQIYLQNSAFPRFSKEILMVAAAPFLGSHSGSLEISHSLSPWIVARKSTTTTPQRKTWRHSLAARVGSFTACHIACHTFRAACKVWNEKKWPIWIRWLRMWATGNSTAVVHLVPKYQNRGKEQYRIVPGNIFILYS